MVNWLSQNIQEIWQGYLQVLAGVYSLGCFFTATEIFLLQGGPVKRNMILLKVSAGVASTLVMLFISDDIPIKHWALSFITWPILFSIFREGWLLRIHRQRKFRIKTGTFKDALPMIDFIVDVATGKVTHLSGDVEEVLGGYTKPEIIQTSRLGEFAEQLIIDEYKVLVYAAYEDIKNGYSRIIDYMIRGKDGERHWIRQSMGTVRDTYNKIVAIEVHCDSITEVKRAEAEIEILARFPRDNPNPVLRIADNGIILYANHSSASLLDLWGCSVGEILPKKWTKKVSDVLNSGIIEIVEIECETRTLSLTLAPFRDLGYINIYGLDITSLKLAEIALALDYERTASERAFYRTVLDNCPAMIWAKDVDGRLTLVNQAAYNELLFLPSTSVIGKTTPEIDQLYQEAYPGDPGRDILSKQAVLSDNIALNTGNSHRTHETTKIQGHRLDIDVYKAPLRGKNNRIIGLVGCALDVTKFIKNKEFKDILISALGAIPFGITVTKNDIERTIIWANHAQGVMVNRSCKQLVGQSSKIFAPEYLHKTKVKDVRQFFQEHVTVNQTVNGNFFPVKILSIRIHKNIREEDVLVTISQKLQNDLFSQDAVALCFGEGRVLLHDTPLLLLLLSADRHVIAYNSALLDSTGYSESEVEQNPDVLQLLFKNFMEIRPILPLDKTTFFSVTNTKKGVTKDQIWKNFQSGDKTILIGSDIEFDQGYTSTPQT